jgi:hypothetical protein
LQVRVLPGPPRIPALWEISWLFANSAEVARCPGPTTRNWADLCDSVTDNFRVISPKDFRVMA